MATKQIPETMKALLYNQSAKTLELASSCPVPKPQADTDQHLVKVQSTAITNGELLWPQNQASPEAYKDYSPGVEMAGEVVKSPPNSKFPVGSVVYGRTTFPRCGSAREYTIALEQELALQPRNLTSDQASTIPVSAHTAWQALFVQAGFKPLPNESQGELSPQERKKVLIIGASGGVGMWATQLACVAGFWVAGTCSTRNVKMVRAFGAHEVLDYTKTSIRQWVDDHNESDKFDLVLDCATDGTSYDSWCAARSDNGLLLSIVPPADMVFIWTLPRPEGISPGVEGRFFIMNPDGEQLRRIAELVEAGKLRTMVDSVFGLDDYEKAFDRAGSGKTKGKVVFHVQQ